MKTTFRPIILMFLVLTLSEVKCGAVTIKIEESQPTIDNEEEKSVSVLITHGKATDQKLTKSKYFDFAKFTCLEENESIEIYVGGEKPNSFQVTVKTSFDFGTYEVHNPDNAITELNGTNKVCFFTGYFIRQEFAEQDKAELYLKFFTDETTFDFTKILSLYIMVSEKEVFTVLQSIQDQDTKDIKLLEKDYDINNIAAYSFKKEVNDKDTKVKLHEQTFELNGLGMFKVYFIDPKYRLESLPLEVYFGENDEVPGLVKITYIDKEVNIIFPDPENTKINGQPII